VRAWTAAATRRGGRRCAHGGGEELASEARPVHRWLPDFGRPSSRMRSHKRANKPDGLRPRRRQRSSRGVRLASGGSRLFLSTFLRKAKGRTLAGLFLRCLTSGRTSARTRSKSNNSAAPGLADPVGRLLPILEQQVQRRVNEGVADLVGPKWSRPGHGGTALIRFVWPSRIWSTRQRRGTPRAVRAPRWW